MPRADAVGQAKYEVVADHEWEYSRTELRRYEDHWRMVRLRRAVIGGGWYIKDSMEVPD